jgi:alkanesulfonate monooxygenase SsuD/methylene tetrahydromethanopterin reductase-like flavin-dependent oxidoreductase (luciferase family)
MRRLWGDAISSYSGEFVKFEGVRSNPKPIRGADLPILFGGESTPALRRVAEYGNGWFGFNLTPDDTAAKLRKMEELLKANHRKLSEIEIIVSPYTKKIVPDDLKRYRDAGVHEMVVVNIRPPKTVEEAAARLEEAARTWLDAASKL